MHGSREKCLLRPYASLTYRHAEIGTFPQLSDSRYRDIAVDVRDVFLGQQMMIFKFSVAGCGGGAHILGDIDGRGLLSLGRARRTYKTLVHYARHRHSRNSVLEAISSRGHLAGETSDCPFR